MKLKISSPHGVPVIIETRTVNDLSEATRFAASSISRDFDSTVFDIPKLGRAVRFDEILIESLERCGTATDLLNQSAECVSETSMMVRSNFFIGRYLFIIPRNCLVMSLIPGSSSVLARP